jgi:hypothetical protein
MMGSLVEERLTPIMGAFTNFGIFEKKKEIVTINEWTSKLETFKISKPEVLHRCSELNYPHPSTIFQIDPDHYGTVWVRLVDRIDILDKHLQRRVHMIPLTRSQAGLEYHSPTPLCTGYAISPNKRQVLVHYISRPTNSETAVATLKLYFCRAGAPQQVWTKVIPLQPNTVQLVQKYYLKANFCGLHPNSFSILIAEKDEVYVRLVRHFHLQHRQNVLMKIPVGKLFITKSCLKTKNQSTA